jgi:hypothetical protein
MHWDLRRHVWFWITIVFCRTTSGTYLLLIPWDDRNLTWIALLPVVVLDYGLVYGCVKLLEKMMKRSGRESSANPAD